MSEKKSPKQVLQAFYAAEASYMQAKESGGEASFSAIAATLDPAVVLHPSPDLPFGGDLVGHAQDERWTIAMSFIFDKLEVADQEWFESQFTTRSGTNGSSQDFPTVQVVAVRNGKITDFRPFYWNVPAYVSAAKSK